MSGRRLSRRASQPGARRGARGRGCAAARRGGRLTVTSRLLARELSNTESELPAAKSPGVGRRRSTRRSSSSSRGRDGRPSSRAASDAYAAEGRVEHGGSKAFAEQLAGAPAHLMEGSVGKTSTTSSNTGSSSTAVGPRRRAARRRARLGRPHRRHRAAARAGLARRIPRGDDGGGGGGGGGRERPRRPSAAADAVFRAAPPLEHAWCRARARRST